MDKPTYFYLPKTNLMGVGCLNHLGKELLSRGYKRALIVTDQNLINVGHVGKVEQILKDNDITYTIYDGIEHTNPTVTFVENGLKHLKKHNMLSKNYDCIISVGGGTNHDTARSIAALATNGGSIADYEGLNKFKRPILPWVAVNTTAGAGAQVTMLDVITDDTRESKISLIDPKTLATITVNDPTMHITAPKEVTIASGIDVLTHGVEAYVALNATPFTDNLALGAIKLLFNYLRRVVNNGNDLEAREKMAYAATMAATAFNNAGLGHTHTIAHQVGGFSNRYHGLTAAALLPYVLEFNSPSIAVERFVDMAAAMGKGEVSGQSAIETVLTAIRELYADIGIPEDLSDMGAKEKDIKYYAEMALKDVAGYTNPRQATEEDLIQLIKKAMKMETAPQKTEREPALSHR